MLFTRLVTHLKQWVAPALILGAGLATLGLAPSVYDTNVLDVEGMEDVVYVDTTYDDGRFVILKTVTCMAGLCQFDEELPNDYSVRYKNDKSQALLFTWETGFGDAVDSASVDSMWADWGYLDPQAYALAVPGEPSGELYANEPAGFVQLTERIFSARGEDGWLGGDVDYDLDFSFATIKPGPTSPDSYGVARYLGSPDSVVGSLTPFNIYSASANIAEFESDSLYFAYWFRLSDDWYGHPSGVNKVMFMHIIGFASSPLYTSVKVIEDGAAEYQVRKQSGGTNLVGADNYSGNTVNSSAMNRGQWYKLEHLLVLNTDTLCTEGVDCDGEIKVWMDNALIIDTAGIDLWRSGAGYWNGVKWNPIWGGTKGLLLDDQYQHIDHIYASGNSPPFPNLPADMTTIVASRFNDNPTTGFNDISSDTQYAVVSTATWNPNGATLDNVSTPPYADDDSIAVALFDPDLGTGNAPINLNMDPSYAANDQQYNEAYYAFYFQATPNHTVSNVNKIGFVELGDSTATNGGSSIYFGLTTPGPLYSDSFTFAWFQQGPGTPENYFADRYTCSGGRIIKAGTWHLIEMYTKLNSVTAEDSVVQDGLLRVWIDGTLCATSDTMSFRGFPHPDAGNRVFSRWKFNPTNGSIAVADTSYQMISHLLFSGKKTD